MVFFHKIDGSFDSNIETNGLVQLQELPQHFANIFFGVL